MNRYIEYTNGDSITYFTIPKNSNDKNQQETEYNFFSDLKRAIADCQRIYEFKFYDKANINVIAINDNMGI